MIQEVFPNIFKIEVPIPNNPLKALNSYVVLGKDRNLVIDTGLKRDECIDALRQGLKELTVNPDKTDYFITHMHADHSGAVGEVASPTANVYASRADSEVINSMGTEMAHWQRMKEYAVKSGLPLAVAEQAIQNHPGFKYGSKNPISFQIVGEGDRIEAGDYTFYCVETPGHTRGHLCLYESGKKLLFSGDHILNHITPNISSWTDNSDCLARYFDSLDKVAALEVSMFFPGHRWPGTNCRERIEELKAHHRQRNEDILAILGQRQLSAYEVAAEMRWDLSYTVWEQFPAPQKWFAVGEAVAHLQYLEQKGKIARTVDKELIRYIIR